jgi:hypothetical protein
MHVLKQPHIWSNASAWKDWMLQEIIRNDPDVITAKNSLNRARDWDHQTGRSFYDANRVQRIMQDIAAKSKDAHAPEARRLIDRRHDPPQRKRRGLSR